MKKYLLLLMIVTPLASCADGYMTLTMVRQKATDYYEAFRLISQDPNGEQSRMMKMHLMSDVVGVDDNGHHLGQEFRVPNDLAFFDNDSKQKSLPELAIPTYVNTFIEMAVKTKMFFSYVVKDCEYLTGTEMYKRNSVPRYARVVVEKTMRMGDVSETITDTVLVNVLSSSFVRIVNLANSGVSDLDENALYAKAEALYNDKKYLLACHAYKQLLRNDPTYDKANFAMGVMALKGQGCMKQYNRKVRDYMVEFYWKRSSMGVEQLKLNHNIVVLPPYPDDIGIEPFNSGLMVAYNYAKERFGFISESGKMVIEQKYDFVHPFFEDGTAIVHSEIEGYLRIDSTGKIIDVLRFDYDDKNKIFNYYGRSETDHWAILFDFIPIAMLRDGTAIAVSNYNNKAYWIDISCRVKDELVFKKDNDRKIVHFYGSDGSTHWAFGF